MSQSLYDILGIARDASKELIRGAYKRAVKSAHPDQGGKREDFDKVQQAYKILSDPVKRLTYDSTGKINDESQSDRQSQLLNTIQIVIEKLIENAQDATESLDLIGQTRETFTNGIEAVKDHIKTIEKKIGLYERITKRVKAKKNKNMIALMLQHKIDEMLVAKAKAQGEMEIAREALAMLDDYEFDVKAPEPTRTRNARH